MQVVRIRRRPSPGSREASSPVEIVSPAARRTNVGGAERIASVAGGSILAVLGISRGTLPGMVAAGLGGALLLRGSTGHCPVYEALGVDTSREGEKEEEIVRRGIRVEGAFLVDRAPDDLYRSWRDLENLPRIMSHLRSVRVIDGRRSLWTADAPWLAGGEVEWEAEITRDEPGAAIAWCSVPGSEIETTGEVRFERAPGDRGTEVRVALHYVPAGGRLGHWIAKLTGHGPWRTIREDLRNFKRIQEAGEVPTTAGQPRGTCSGAGVIEGE